MSAAPALEVSVGAHDALGPAPGGRVRAGALVAANVAGALAFAWPFALPAAVGTEAHATDGPWVLVVLVALLAVLLGLELGRGGMGPKTVALVGVLGAVMVALRLPGFVNGFSATWVVLLAGGSAFGPAFGFVLGATGMFASGLFVGGLGPWLPFQMVAAGWIGAGAGLVPRPRDRRARVALLAAYGFVAAFAFGAVMNLWFWPFATRGSELGWLPDAGVAANAARYARFYAVTSAPWDAFGAVGNAVLVAVLGRPLLAALDRAARRMNVRVERRSPYTPGRRG